MTTTVEAIYENGVLKLPQKLPLPEQARVTVTICSENPDATDEERAAWLALSEKSLMKTWDNTDDDVFNELLKK